MDTGLARQDARDDFDHARRRANWAQLAGWLHGRPSNRLPVLGEAVTTARQGRPCGGWSTSAWAAPGRMLR